MAGRTADARLRRGTSAAIAGRIARSRPALGRRRRRSARAAALARRSAKREGGSLAFLLLEVRGAQRGDESRVDEPRGVALIVERVILSELVDRRDRFLVELRIVARVGRARGAVGGDDAVVLGLIRLPQFLHLRRVRRRRRIRKGRERRT